jgi:CDP-diacylglycerol---glycerol-3-phosphate 3-phosphatidyltransferase
MNLPNLISSARIVMAVALVPLLFVDRFDARILAFALYLAAALSDIWDGYLARSQGLVTDLGKLLDPLADKLLLAASIVPFYILSNFRGPEGQYPWFGGVFPLWILIVLLGRELFITLFRGYAARRGVVIAAGRSGKFKTIFQSIAAASAIFWYALHSAARDQGWTSPAWDLWVPFNFWLSAASLAIAVVLTVWSMGVYLWSFRWVWTGGRPG